MKFYEDYENGGNMCHININIYIFYIGEKIKHMIVLKIRTVPLSERVLRKILLKTHFSDPL